MRSIKQIREQFDEITDRKSIEERRLEVLVDSGLMEETKLPLVKRAMNENNHVLTPSEKRALMGLLESLIHNTVSEDLRPAPTRMSDMPSILVLKRKAIRIYPGGKNVGLYYSQQLDKYVAVPFGGKEDQNVIQMAEEEQLDEISNKLANATYAKRAYAAVNADDEDERKIHAFKAGKTVTRRLAKSYPAGINMHKFAKNYADAMNDTQASYKTKGKKKALPPLKKPDTGEQLPPPQDVPMTSGKKKKNKKNKEPENLASAINSGGMQGAMFHLLGPALHRAGAKLRSKALMTKSKQLEEEMLEEGVVGTALRLGKMAIGSKTGRAIAKRYLRRKFNNTKNNKGSSSSGSPRQKRPLDVKQSPGAERQARLSPKTRNPFDDFRGRQANISWASQGTPSSRQQQVQENVSVELDGNSFQLNSIVAKKLQHVYESLNKKNKKKMIDMLNESEESFNKVISFVVRH